MSGKVRPRKTTVLGRLTPGIIPRGKLPLRKMLPEKFFYYIFVAVDIILQLYIFKLFIVTSFRGVSKSPAASIMDFFVTLVYGIN